MGQPSKNTRAERDAYYRRIGRAHLTPLWESMSALVPETAGLAVRAGALEVRRGAPVADGIRQPDHREGSGAPRADPGEPRACPASPRSRSTLYAGLAADSAGRGRAQPSPYPDCVAPDRRRLRRLHRGGRRARHHASGRFHHHAVVDLARPRQPGRASRWCGWTASIFRWCAFSTAALPRTIRATEQEVVAARRAMRWRATATISCRSTTSLRGTSSPVFAYPYARSRESLRAAGARWTSRTRATGTRWSSSIPQAADRRCRA